MPAPHRARYGGWVSAREPPPSCRSQRSRAAPRSPHHPPAAGSRLRHPGFVIARRSRAAAALLERAGRAIGKRCAGEIGYGRLLPGARRRQRPLGHIIDLMVEPAEPFGLNPAGIVRTVIDHPAPGDAIGVGAALIIDIAKAIRPDARPSAQAKHGAEGGAVPPREDFSEDAHAQPLTSWLADGQLS